MAHDARHGSAIAPEAFRLDDPAIQRDPYPYYPALRERTPVLETTVGDRSVWVVSRHEDVVTVLSDPATYSSATAPTPTLLVTDPPEHRPLRRMLAGAFTRRAIDKVADALTARADGLVDEAVRAGGCDVVADVAVPLTVATIAQLLGVAVDDVENLHRLALAGGERIRELRLGVTGETPAKANFDELIRFASSLVEEADPDAEGVVSHLAGHRRRGELGDESAAHSVVLLLVAGHTTTTNLIANGVHLLCRHPEETRRLRAEPARTDAFVEETLRLRPSFHRILRVTTVDTELAGRSIPAGSDVRRLLASANLDPDAAPEPDSFDPDRFASGPAPQKHLGFGYGIHTCLGQWLARREAVVALTALTQRASEITPDPDHPAVPHSGGTFNEFGFTRFDVLLR